MNVCFGQWFWSLVVCIWGSGDRLAVVRKQNLRVTCREWGRAPSPHSIHSSHLLGWHWWLHFLSPHNKELVLEAQQPYSQQTVPKKEEWVRGRVQPFLTVVGTMHTHFSDSSLMRPRAACSESPDGNWIAFLGWIKWNMEGSATVAVSSQVVTAQDKTYLW